MVKLYCTIYIQLGNCAIVLHNICAIVFHYGGREKAIERKLLQM